MRICNWLPKQDHARIALSITLPSLLQQPARNMSPWSIPQPRLFNLNELNRKRCKDHVGPFLDDLLLSYEQAKAMQPLSLDFLSESTANIIVEQVGQILGSKSDTHKKGKYSSSDVCRIRGLISTLTKACDLIRTLSQDEVNTDVERREVQDHLVVLFDRLVRMGIYTIPPLEVTALVEWSKSTATQEIQLLRDYLEAEMT